MLNLRSSMCLEEYVMDTEASFASTADGFEDYVPFTSAALIGPPTSSPEVPVARNFGSADVDRVAPEADTEASFASTADGFEDYVPFTSDALLGPPTSSPRPEPQLQPHLPAIAVQPESLASPPHRRCSSPDNASWMRMRTPSPENTYSGYATGRAPPGPPGILLKTPVFVQQQCMPVLCYVGPSNIGVNGEADAESGVGSMKRQSLPSVASWSTMASEDDRGLEAEDAQCLACGDPEVPESNFAMESKGSRGHPYSCASACKYIKKTRGCKDGADCNRCHLCAFHNKSKKPGMSGGAQQKATVGW